MRRARIGPDAIAITDIDEKSEGHMARVFRSLSDQPMEITDADRILCIIMDLPSRPMKDLRGQEVIGVHSAVEIRDALRDEGFEIVRADKREA